MWASIAPGTKVGVMTKPREEHGAPGPGDGVGSRGGDGIGVIAAQGIRCGLGVSVSTMTGAGDPDATADTHEPVANASIRRKAAWRLNRTP